VCFRGWVVEVRHLVVYISGLGTISIQTYIPGGGGLGYIGGDPYNDCLYTDE